MFNLKWFLQLRQRGVLHAILALCALLLLPTPVLANSPFASELIDSAGLSGSSLYDDPQAILGKPTTDFYDPFPFSGSAGPRRVKLIEPAYNRTADQSAKVITTFNTGDWSVVKFDHAVEDDPNNPFGIDLLVFGNSFYVAGGASGDDANMNNVTLSGGVFSERVLVSVSPGYQSLPGEDESDHATWQWHDYDEGPFGDNAFPTQAYQWDRDNAMWSDQEMDFTKPVDPTLASTLAGGGLSAADAIDLYDGSGGGTGFDLAASGFAAIQYVRVAGVSGASGGEIDAFADVAPLVDAIVGDYDGSGVVDMGDYAIWRSSFGSTTQLAADGNNDGKVDAADYTIWRDNLDAGVTSLEGLQGVGTVPEPGTAMLLVSGMILLARERGTQCFARSSASSRGGERR